MEKVRHNQSTTLSFEDLVAQMPGQVYYKNQEGLYLACNDQHAKSLGFLSKKDVIGKTDADLLGSNESLQTHVADEGSQIYEEVVSIDGKRIVYLSFKIGLKTANGKPQGVLGLSIDITKQKEAEDRLTRAKEIAIEQDKAKTVFLENMRHDFRAPLTSIIALLEILDQESDKSKVQQYIKSSIESGKELLRFFNDILESVNIDSGQIPLLEKTFNLEDVLQNVIKLHRAIASKNDLSLILKVDERIPAHLIGDPVRIYRILLELITNGLKFTKKGEIRILANLAKKEGSQVVLQIFVEDTGIGIPSHRLQTLFARFKPHSATLEEQEQGTGLGLLIVKEFIDDLQGEIHVESQLNVGTRFVCVIPLKEPLLIDPFACENSRFIESGSSLYQGEKSQAPAAIQDRKKRGLIVEDQPIAALVAKVLLGEQGCQIDVAENGKSAIEYVKKQAYDFILMDIGLPDIYGYEVTKAVRMLEKKTSQRTFIAGLTSHLDAGKKVLGLKAGMDMVLTKPLTREVVRHLLEELIPASLSGLRVGLLQTEADLNFPRKIPKKFDISKKEIFELFIKNLVNEELLLDQAYLKKDWETVQKIAHKIAGSCDYCGASELRAWCRQVEDFSTEKEPEQLELLYQKMREEMDRLKKLWPL